MLLAEHNTRSCDSMYWYHLSVTGEIVLVITLSTGVKPKAQIRFIFAKGRIIVEIHSDMVEDDSKLQMSIAHLNATQQH